MKSNEMDPLANAPSTESPTKPSTASSTPALGRRSFLGRVGAGAAAVATVSVTGLSLENTARAAGSDDAAERVLESASALANRRSAAYRMRVNVSKIAKARPLVEHTANGDETRYAPGVASYSKGLAKDDLGLPDATSYGLFVHAMTTNRADDFEAIQLGQGRKLVNPQAGLAFDLEGADTHHLASPPAPAFASAEQAGEMVELYWMSLARDVSFSDYATAPLVARAAAELSGLSDFRGPKQNGAVTTATIFRGTTAGETAGPFVSQFLLKDVPLGANTISGRMKTAVPGVDYMADYFNWREVQCGRINNGANQIDPTPRYIRNLRDLGQWVHNDMPYQAYLNAAQLLFAQGAPLGAGFPLNQSATQAGFVEFGGPHVLTLLAEVSTRALKAVWYQKWQVHRRIRPEELGGRVHNQKTGAADYALHADVMQSDVLGEVFAKQGTYLLSQAYPEGSPTHPSYGSGHATNAGASVTILKAFFGGSTAIANPVVPSEDGTALEPYTGAELTVEGELNKLAANISTGRNAAGVHWRTDFTAGIALGEEVAICVLQEQANCHNQPFTFEFTKFDGTRIKIFADHVEVVG